MKRCMTIVALLLLACVFSSCGFFSLDEPDTEGTGPAGLTLSKLDEGIRAAAPTECRITVAATYKDPTLTLTSCATLKKSGNAEYYTYEIERLLPTDEAVAVGSHFETLTGHLHVVDGHLESASAEVDSELLSEISSLNIRLPGLSETYFSTYEITEADGGVTLTATVKDSAIDKMLDDSVQLTGLSFEIKLSADLVPSSLAATYTGAGGGAVCYTAEYGYGAVTIP